MAEVLGVAASIIAVIQIASSLISTCKRYIESVERVPSELRLILIEIAAIEGVFQNLRYLNDKDAANSSTILQELSDPINGCRECMAELQNLLPSDTLTTKEKTISQKLKTNWVNLTWSIHRPKVGELLEKIAVYKSTITLAFSSDISLDVKTILKKLDGISSTLLCRSLGSRRELANSAAPTGNELREICNWLKATDPSAIHRRASQDFVCGTGEWVLRCPEWRAWLDSLQQCLWIHGIPGAGKTVLASYIIGQLDEMCRAEKPETVDLFYYCHFSHNQDESEPFLKWVLSQLCRRAKLVPAGIQECYNLDRGPTASDLLSGLADILGRYNRVYVTLDAVDESEDRSKILSAIETLCTDSRFNKLQLLVTSREYSDIETSMKAIAKPLSMSNEFVQSDIRCYVSTSLHKDEYLRKWSRDLLDDIEESLANGAKGMFRWAVCQIDIIRRLRVASEVQDALRKMPQTLDETYDRIFSLIPGEYVPLVHHALRLIHFYSWIWPHRDIFASPELILESYLRLVRQDDLDSDSHTYDIHALKEACGCLVKFSKSCVLGSGSDEVEAAQLAHYTVKEYLASHRTTSTALSTLQFPSHGFDFEYIKLFLDAELESTIPEDADRHLSSLSHHCTTTILMVTNRLWEDMATDSELVAETCRCLYPRLLVDYVNPQLQHYPGLRTRRAVLSEEFERFWDVALPGEAINELKWKSLPHPPELLALVHWLCDANIPAVTFLVKEIVDLAAIFEREVDITIDSCWALVSTTDDSDTMLNFRGSFLELCALVCVLPRAHIEQAFRILLRSCPKPAESPHLLHLFLISRTARSNCKSSILRDVIQKSVRFGGSQSYVTPLQIACYLYDWRAVKMLLEAGADHGSLGDESCGPWEDNTVLSQFNDLHGRAPLNILAKSEQHFLGHFLKSEANEARRRTIKALELHRAEEAIEESFQSMAV